MANSLGANVSHKHNSATQILLMFSFDKVIFLLFSNTVLLSNNIVVNYQGQSNVLPAVFKS